MFCFYLNCMPLTSHLDIDMYRSVICERLESAINKMMKICICWANFGKIKDIFISCLMRFSIFFSTMNCKIHNLSPQSIDENTYFFLRYLYNIKRDFVIFFFILNHLCRLFVKEHLMKFAIFF